MVPVFSGTFSAEAKKVSGKLEHVGHPAFMVFYNPKSLIQQGLVKSLLQQAWC